MTRDKLTETVEQALRDAVGSAVVDNVDVAEGHDHDGDPVLFVTIRYRPGQETVDQTAALRAVRDKLMVLGENRFPHINHVYPDDVVADDN